MCVLYSRKLGSSQYHSEDVRWMLLKSSAIVPPVVTSGQKCLQKQTLKLPVIKNHKIDEIHDGTYVTLYLLLRLALYVLKWRLWPKLNVHVCYVIDIPNCLLLLVARCVSIPKRYLVIILAFVGYFFRFLIELNLDIVIVDMASNKTISSGNETKIIVSTTKKITTYSTILAIRTLITVNCRV